MSAITRGNITSQYSGNIGTSPILAQVPANANRQFVMIQNVHASNNIAFSFDGTTPALNTAGSFMLSSNQAVILDVMVVTNAINFIASGATTPVTVITLE